MKTYQKNLFWIANQTLICRKWYDNNKRSLVTALHSVNPFWITHDSSTKCHHQSKLKPRYSIFPEHSITLSFHLFFPIDALFTTYYMIHCIILLIMNKWPVLKWNIFDFRLNSVKTSVILQNAINLFTSSFRKIILDFAQKIFHDLGWLF